MKKLLTLVLAIAMLVSCMVFPAAAEEMPTITWMMSGDNNPPADNDVITAIRERTGVNLQVTYISTGDFNTKLNTMIASGTEPDIFRISGQDLLDLKAAGRIINIEPLMAENAPDMLAFYDMDDLRKNAANGDDGIYALMGYAGRYHKCLTIRKDWLEAVGKEVPTTMEELYDVLYAFTYNDPDGNGQNDTWGIGVNGDSFDFWTNMFGGFGIPVSGASSAVELEDGTVTTWLKHPKTLEALTYFNKLYNDGLINPDFVTLTGMQTFEQLWNQKVGMLGFQAVGTTNNWYPGRYTWDVASDPAEEFTFAWLNGNGGYKIYPNYTDGTVISANCKNPEAALKVINYMYFTEEGQELIYMGIEGKHFEWVDKAQGKYQRLGIYTDDTTHRAAGAFVYGYGWTNENAETRVMNKLTQETQVLAAEKALALPNFTVTLESRTEYGADLDALVKECFANMIVAKAGTDLEAMLNDYITRWEDEGGLDYEAEATELWAASK